MKKKNINNYYTDEDLINFEKLKNFNDSKVNKLSNNQNKRVCISIDIIRYLQDFVYNICYKIINQLHIFNYGAQSFTQSYFHKKY